MSSLHDIVYTSASRSRCTHSLKLGSRFVATELYRYRCCHQIQSGITTSWTELPVVQLEATGAINTHQD